MTQAYDVNDENDRTILYAVRPTQFGSTLVSMLLIAGGLFAGLVVAMLATAVLWDEGGAVEVAGIVLGVLAGVIVAGAGIALGLGSRPSCSIAVYRDETRKACLLQVQQEGRTRFPSVVFSVMNGSGSSLGTIRWNMLESPFRRRWRCLDSVAGRFHAEEDGNWLVDAFFGQLRHGLKRLSSYRYFAESDDGRHDSVGQCTRRSGLFNVDLTEMKESPDVLHIEGDPDFRVDRRLALAIAMIVDSAEEK